MEQEEEGGEGEGEGETEDEEDGDTDEEDMWIIDWVNTGIAFEMRGIWFDKLRNTMADGYCINLD